MTIFDCCRTKKEREHWKLREFIINNHFRTILLEHAIIKVNMYCVIAGDYRIFILLTHAVQASIGVSVKPREYSSVRATHLTTIGLLSQGCDNLKLLTQISEPRSNSVEYIAFNAPGMRRRSESMRFMETFRYLLVNFIFSWASSFKRRRKTVLNAACAIPLANTLLSSTVFTLYSKLFMRVTGSFTWSLNSIW